MFYSPTQHIIRILKYLRASFVLCVFTATKDDLVGRLEFEIPEDIMRRIESYPSPEVIFKTDLELGQDVENLVKKWFKKIEQVSYMSYI